MRLKNTFHLFVRYKSFQPNKLEPILSGNTFGWGGIPPESVNEFAELIICNTHSNVRRHTYAGLKMATDIVRDFKT